MRRMNEEYNDYCKSQKEQWPLSYCARKKNGIVQVRGRYAWDGECYMVGSQAAKTSAGSRLSGATQ
jgi:hypothetical protein